MPEVAAERIIQAADGKAETCVGILGLSFNPGSDDVRDTPSAKIIEALNRRGWRNILAYDPVAMKVFQSQYHLEYQCAETYEQILEDADLFAITTAWTCFKNLKRETGKPIVDCRYCL